MFRRRPGLSQEENLKWASRLLGVEYDKGAKDITRVFFTPPTDRLLYIDKELFDNGEAEVTEELKQGGAEASQASGQALQASAEGSQVSHASAQASAQPSAQGSQAAAGEAYLGIPYALIIDRWWAMYNDGQTPVRSNRNTLTFELAVNLRHICGFDRKVLDRVIPCYDGFPEAEKLACIDSALAEKRTQMPKRLKDVLLAVRQERMGQAEGGDGMEIGRASCRERV